MQRMKWWLLWWLLLFMSHAVRGQNDSSGGWDSWKANCTDGYISCCMTYIDYILENENDYDDDYNYNYNYDDDEEEDYYFDDDAIQCLEDLLEEEEINGTGNVVTYQYKPNGTFEGLSIYASDQEASEIPLPNNTVSVELPAELKAGPNNTIVFRMFKWNGKNPVSNYTLLHKKSFLGASDEVYDQRLVGLSVQGKNISGLQQHINITMNLNEKINETQKPSCQFLKFSAKKFSPDGCITRWTRGQDNITCSCDHLTYFAVLMLPVSPVSLSSTDQKILTYISLIGCSLSLFALIITVLLFITNRKLRDVSMNVHINLVIALILLNLHFLLSNTVTAGSSTGLCLYLALLLHYSLLATFTWMALEGFNLYLLVVKIFDIYVSRYLLKLSVVGWGVPAVIVSVVVIKNREFYGLVPLDESNSNNTAICYITNEIVTMGTTLGPFSMMFLFNVIVFAVTVRRVFSVRHRNEIDRKRVRQHICPLLGVSALLGITWGLIFFSFGPLTAPGLYLFCILNSLQGFLIFLWFVMSLRKVRNSAPPTSSVTRSTIN